MSVEPEYDLPRDLEGYGENSINPEWPNDAPLAISFILNYEEGAERTIVNGDAQSEPYLWEKGASGTFLHGARHLSAESEFEYGSRSGCWRLLRLFREFSYPFTLWACGQAFEKNPSFAKACVRDGHEIAAHGQRWLDISHMGIEEEKEYMRANIRSLKATTGKLVRGFFYGRGTERTRALFGEVLKEEGGDGESYCSEAFNDDVPYWIDAPTLPEGILIVPYNYDLNDGKFYMSPGFTGTSYLSYLKGTFDMLYREGLAGSPKLMNIPMHSRISGKPGRSEDLRKFMLYVKEREKEGIAMGKGGVWVAKREEIAKHWRNKFPYVKGCLAPGRRIGLGGE